MFLEEASDDRRLCQSHRYFRLNKIPKDVLDEQRLSLEGLGRRNVFEIEVYYWCSAGNAKATRSINLIELTYIMMCCSWKIDRSVVRKGFWIGIIISPLQIIIACATT